MANWHLIGELTVTNSWQFFPQNIVNTELFRITTTIQDVEDWTKWKFKSAAYLRFYYPDGSISFDYYIKVSDVPVIRQFPVPDALASNGYLVRSPAIIRASRFLPITPNNNFAQWNFRLEEYF